MKNSVNMEHEKESAADAPAAGSFVSSPLRNRIRVELKAPVAQVWALVGDLSRFPEFSAGLEKVEATVDASGRCTEYLCRFKPMEEGGASIESREIVRWYEPNRGYASSSAGADAFGLKNDLNRVVLEASRGGTALCWEEYYEASDLGMMKAHFDHALADIADNLVRRFGGKLTERFVEG